MDIIKYIEEVLTEQIEKNGSDWINEAAIPDDTYDSPIMNDEGFAIGDLVYNIKNKKAGIGKITELDNYTDEEKWYYVEFNDPQDSGFYYIWELNRPNLNEGWDSKGNYTSDDDELNPRRFIDLQIDDLVRNKRDNQIYKVVDILRQSWGPIVQLKNLNTGKIANINYKQLVASTLEPYSQHYGHEEDLDERVMNTGGLYAAMGKHKPLGKHSTRKKAKNQFAAINASKSPKNKKPKKPAFHLEEGDQHSNRYVYDTISYELFTVITNNDQDGLKLKNYLDGDTYTVPQSMYEQIEFLDQAPLIHLRKIEKINKVKLTMPGDEKEQSVSSDYYLGENIVEELKTSIIPDDVFNLDDGLRQDDVVIITSPVVTTTHNNEKFTFAKLEGKRFVIKYVGIGDAYLIDNFGRWLGWVKVDDFMIVPREKGDITTVDFDVPEQRLSEVDNHTDTHESSWEATKDRNTRWLNFLTKGKIDKYNEKPVKANPLSAPPIGESAQPVDEGFANDKELEEGKSVAHLLGVPPGQELSAGIDPEFDEYDDLLSVDDISMDSTAFSDNIDIDYDSTYTSKIKPVKPGSVLNYFKQNVGKKKPMGVLNYFKKNVGKKKPIKEDIYESILKALK